MSKLICTKCKKEIKAGDKIVVELVLPNGFTMPFGSLDTILEKKSISIHCKECSY
jgi:hypothetical protein